MLDPLDKVISALPLTSLYFPDYKRYNNPGFMFNMFIFYYPEHQMQTDQSNHLGQFWKKQAEEPSPAGCAVPSPKCWALTLATGQSINAWEPFSLPFH